MGDREGTKSSLLSGGSSYSYGATTTHEPPIVADDDGEDSCSVFETTCNLTTVLTGSGLLSLPFAMYLSGWISLVYLVVLACMFLYSFCLLADSIETYYINYRIRYRMAAENQRYYPAKGIDIDYLSLGKATFGRYGDRIVSLVFGVEFFLALVSFFINIGLNINAMNSEISPLEGIIISGVITSSLALMKLKLAAYSSMLGLSMTLLTVLAVVLSGVELKKYFAANPKAFQESEYQIFVPQGTPLALGLIAFCFGGHATFPKMYLSMAERNRYLEVLFYTGSIVILLYGFVMAAGYYIFADHTLTPITLNIGRDYNHITLSNGASLRIIAALGIVFNLQVTCPLITVPLRDMIIKHFDNRGYLYFDEEAYDPKTIRTNRGFLSTFIVLLATLVALLLRGHFASVCALIGSVTTIINSIVFPIAFYHAVHGHHTIPLYKNVLHACILVVAVSCGLFGVLSDACNMFDSHSTFCSALEV